MIRTQVKPKLIEGDDVMPCSIELDFEHLQESPGQIDSLPFAHLTEHVAPIEGDSPQIPAIG
jgi:hypothetical protein